MDELQSSSKDGKYYKNIGEQISIHIVVLDLIKYVLALQQKHQGKIAQVDPSHMKAIRRPDMQVLQQQNALDRDSP